MNATRPIWLVNNASSGSNDDAALAALEACCGEHGFHVAHRTVFPDAGPAHARPMLDAAGIDRVAVFAGDGTINAADRRRSPAGAARCWCCPAGR